MSFKLGYSSLKWSMPSIEDLEGNLEQVKAAGWEGWELRQSLDWLGEPERVQQICNNAV